MFHDAENDLAQLMRNLGNISAQAWSNLRKSCAKLPKRDLRKYGLNFGKTLRKSAETKCLRKMA